MGKDLKGKELGIGISQRSDKFYVGQPSDKKQALTVNRSMEYRYSTGEWRIETPKSKAGFRTIPLTDEAVSILKLQKRKIIHLA